MVKLRTNPLAKSTNTLRLIYDTNNATFEDLLERGKSRTIHEDNLHKLLTEIHKSIYLISPQIMWNFFDLKRTFMVTFVVIIC